MPFPLLGKVAAIGGKWLKGAVGRTIGGIKSRAARIASTRGGRVAATTAAAVGGGAAFEGGARFLRGQGADMMMRPRRRRGLSGADIRGAQRVAKLVSTFGFKPKFKRRSTRRRYY